MNWPTQADLGGQPGHGVVIPEPDQPVFHTQWEPRALALTLAAGVAGGWNIDMSRAARETLAGYASLSYYRIWIAALEKLLGERGLVGPDEIAAGHSLRTPTRPLPVLRAGGVAAALSRGTPTLRAAAQPARFGVGERVRTRSHAVDHHTRLPAYARGRIGMVERVHGMHVFADSHAQGLGERPQWLYTVAFDAHELWGDSAEPRCRVSIDAWESYLESAGQ
jgi:nitrile hydratase subunit beta